MKKNAYLSHPATQAFVDWFAAELTKPNHPHSYQSARGRHYAFDGLDAAMQQYDWGFKFNDEQGKLWQGSSLAENQIALSHITHHLQDAVARQDDEATRIWSTAVMAWGGVMNGNAKWLADNKTGLSAHVATVKAILDLNDDAEHVLKPIQRFNAGMTKVYSLLCDRFIIYDSRVAAALAWFVTHWCRANNQETVPDLLAFPCLAAKEAVNAKLKKVRNPSWGSLSFPTLTGARLHAKWNLRASWILDASLAKAKHASFGDNLRALEAALFMWGYDLSPNLAPTYPKQKL